MNTISICINDTTALCDSTVIELAKFANVQETGLNCNDIWIAIAISATIFLVVLVITVGLCFWQNVKFNYLKGIDKQNNDHEIARKEEEHKCEKERNEQNDMRREKEYQHEREKNEREDARKDKEYQHEKEMNATDHKNILEFIKQIHEAAKDKEGQVDKDVLKLWLDAFRKECKNPNLSETTNA